MLHQKFIKVCRCIRPETEITAVKNRGLSGFSECSSIGRALRLGRRGCRIVPGHSDHFDGSDNPFKASEQGTEQVRRHGFVPNLNGWRLWSKSQNRLERGC